MKQSLLKSSILRGLLSLFFLVAMVGNAWGAEDVYYEQCTAVSDISNNGTYIIVISDGTNYYAVQQNTTNYVAVQPQSDGTIKNPSSSIIWTAGSTTTTNGFTFVCNSKYIYCSGSNTTLSGAGTSSSTWVISAQTTGTNTFKMNLKSSDGRYLGWSGSKYAAYANSNYVNQFETSKTFGQYSGALYIYKVKAVTPATKTDPSFFIADVTANVNDATNVSEILEITTNNTDSYSISYASDDTDVAEISEGVLYAYKEGSCTITATMGATEKFNKATTTFTITIEPEVTKYDVNLTQPEKATIVASPASAAEGAEVTLSYSNVAVHYHFKEWTVLDGNANSVDVDESEGVYTFKMPGSNVEVDASFVEDDTHDVYFYVNGTKSSEDTFYEGDDITFPENPADVYGKKFVGWVADQIDGTTNDKPTFVTSAKMGTESVTYYAVYATVGGSSNPTTVAWNVNGVTTSAEGGKTVNTTLSTSSVSPSTETGEWTAYATNSYAATASLKAQLGSGSYKFAGTITLSGSAIPANATITQIDLTATSSATDANPYSISATVGGSAFGTSQNISSGNANCQWTGTGTGNTIVLTTSCGYNKNIVISALSVQYTYDSYSDYATTVRQKSTTPTITPADGTEFSTATQSVSISADGATIYYTTDGTTPTNESTKYTAAFDISATTTVKAIAYESEKDPSAVVSATITYIPLYTITASAATGGTYTVKIGDEEATNVPAEGTTYQSRAEKVITLTTAASEGYKLHSTPFVVKDAGGTEVKVSKTGDNYTFTMPAKAVTITAQYVQQFTIATTTPENGAIASIKDGDGNDITATSKGSKVWVTVAPDTHYTLSAISVKKADESVVAVTVDPENANRASFTMPQSNVTVSATFAEDPKHNVTFSVNGVAGDPTVVYEGEDITFPATDPEDVNDMKFVGWTEDEINGTTNGKPTFVTSAKMGTQNKVFYAVYADVEGGSSKDIAMSSTSVTSGNITVAAAIGDGSNAPAYTSSECRIYVGNTITVSTTGDDNITAVSFTFHKQGSKGYFATVSANTGTYTSGGGSASSTDDKVDTWEGSAKSITFSTSGTGQRVLVSATVTYGSATYSNYCTTLPTVLTSSANLQGWKTFYNSGANYEVDEKTNIYKASLNGDKVTLNKVEGNIIPSGTAVLLKTTASDYKMYLTETSSNAADDTFSGNILAYTTENTTGYVLGYKNSTLAFYLYSGLPAGKVYIPYRNDGAASLRFVIENEDETGISSISEATEEDNNNFNLSGQKISGSKGLQIKNGKVIMIK